MYDLDKKEYFVSRDVDFFESTFPFAVETFSGDDFVGGNEEFENNGSMEDDLDQSNLLEEVDREKDDGSNVGGGGACNDKEILVETNEQKEKVVNNEHEEIVVENTEHEVRINDGQQNRLGRGHRIKYPSIRLHDYVTNTIRKLSSSITSSVPSHASGILYPIAHYVNCDNFSLQHRSFLAAISADREPKSFVEAVKDGRWRDAMQAEIHALENNGTWVVTQMPPRKKALGCRWVYKIKYKSNDTIERFNGDFW